jgi:hypothetical protein
LLLFIVVDRLIQIKNKANKGVIIMTDETSSIVADTETSAMDAWLRKLDGQQPERFIPTGVPVADPSSQADDSLCSFDVIKRTLP